MLSAIIALGPNNLIGTLDNDLPWKGEEYKFLRAIDMLIFKEFTIGKDLVMGRKTWDSLNRTRLKGRGIHYIITSKPEISNDPTVIYLTLDTFKELIKYSSKEIVCIGGKQLFESLCLHFDIIITNIFKCNSLKKFKNGIYLKKFDFQKEPFNLLIDHDHYQNFYFRGFSKDQPHMDLKSIRYISKAQLK